MTQVLQCINAGICDGSAALTLSAPHVASSRAQEFSRRARPAAWHTVSDFGGRVSVHPAWRRYTRQ